MPDQPYHVAFITSRRMPAGHDWVYLREPEQRPPVLLVRVGVDKRQVFGEVMEMLAAEAEADRLAFQVA